jgi:uncharacterized protein (DUF885 family)
MKFAVASMVLVFIGCLSVQRTPSLLDTENKKLAEIFKRHFEEKVLTEPEYATDVGRKEGYDKLNDQSDEFRIKKFARLRKTLEELGNIRYTFLGDDEKMSYDVFKYLQEINLEGEKFMYHDYPINQMDSVHTKLISLLTNRHLIESVSDANAYISRLNEFPRYFGQVINKLKIRKAKGIVAPQFALEKSIADISNLLKNDVLLEDFKKKVLKLGGNSELVAKAQKAINESVNPSLRELNSHLETLKKSAPKEGGAWTLPRGFAFYDFSLRDFNTTNLTADEIHRLGIKDVGELKNDILKLCQTLGFKGHSWKELRQWVKVNPKFYYANDEAGRKEYLADAERYFKNMQLHLNEAFNIQPRAPLEIRPVEPYRAASAGLAFYEAPSPDGKAPGIFYINLANMGQANRYEVEAILYHEAIPGHHMQVAISRERTDLPDFRRFRFDSAFGEGWALYAERLGKEMGMYTDPISDLGRLTGEIWRSARLVVDTGLHAKKWSMKKTREYLIENTLGNEAEIEESIQRYLVMPGQATAYKIGMRKILEIRENARRRLGKDFDLRKFHDEMLRQGSLPLGLLEAHMDAWVEKLQNKN